MEENKIQPYDEVTGHGLVRHILTRIGKTTGEVMVCLVINGNQIPAPQALIDVLKDIPGMTSISININRENTNVILGSQSEPYGERIILRIILEISAIRFHRFLFIRLIRSRQKCCMAKLWNLPI